jgi:hypothetical protein
MLLDSTLISQIPIKIITKDSTIFPDFLLAKGGIKFRNSLGNSQLVSGFGFNSSRETSAQSARFEALEHLYATYDFQKETIQRKGSFYGAEFSNPDNLQRFSPSSVLIGPLPEDIGKNTDANGLGCHIFMIKQWSMHYSKLRKGTALLSFGMALLRLLKLRTQASQWAIFV